MVDDESREKYVIRLPYGELAVVQWENESCPHRQVEAWPPRLCQGMVPLAGINPILPYRGRVASIRLCPASCQVKKLDVVVIKAHKKKMSKSDGRSAQSPQGKEVMIGILHRGTQVKTLMVTIMIDHLTTSYRELGEHFKATAKKRVEEVVRHEEKIAKMAKDYEILVAKDDLEITIKEKFC
ncbi:hypothetical protein Pfo_008082 [Paulownia fortunei]|nr:hypothetical protein Pfo_008082 [Paulownia fortunei]